MRKHMVHICYAKSFKPGDPAPSGYCDWHEWVRVQDRGGLKQTFCTVCEKWNFPQEHCKCKGGKRLTLRQWKKTYAVDA